MNRPARLDRVIPEQPVKFEYFAEAFRAGLHSSDRDTKVGCVIVGADGEIICSDSNRFPEGVRTDIEARYSRPEKYHWIEHAERNAIYIAARKGFALEGSTMYLPWFPCIDCARAIIQSGIARLVAFEPDVDHPKWGCDFRLSCEMFSEASIELILLDELQQLAVMKWS